MSLKARLSWFVNGGAHTEAAFQQLGDDLRALQLKVESIATAVHGLEGRFAAELHEPDRRRLESAVAAMRDQLRVVTDDLGDRIGAVSQSLNARR